MALAVIHPLTTQQRIHHLLTQAHDHQAQARLLADTKQRIIKYEERFGFSSERIHEAIDAGELVETVDVAEWIFLFNLLRRVEQS